jgi:hypothetical protein
MQLFVIKDWKKRVADDFFCRSLYFASRLSSNGNLMWSDKLGQSMVPFRFFILRNVDTTV